MDYVHQSIMVPGLVHSYATVHMYLHTHTCSQVFWKCVTVPVAFRERLLPNRHICACSFENCYLDASEC